VAKRKRSERAAQAGIIAAALGCVGWAVVSALRMAVPWVMKVVAGGGAL
jgi:hypothetical protein